MAGHKFRVGQSVRFSPKKMTMPVGSQAYTIVRALPAEDKEYQYRCLFALLPQVVDAVKIPVIAAGGVADARTAAAAFVLGACAVQLGTAFLRCGEANVLDAHRAALRQSDDACTFVTDVITGRPARYIKNQLIEDLVRD